MKKIFALLSVCMLFCSCIKEGEISSIKITSNLEAIDSYLGINGEISGKMGGTFFLGTGRMGGSFRGQINDIPKFYFAANHNGIITFKDVPTNQCEIVYINDSTQRKVVAYRKYVNIINNNAIPKQTTRKYYDINDFKYDIDKDSYIEVTHFSDGRCHSTRYTGNNDTGCSKLFGNLDDLKNVTFYRFYLMKEDIVDLSKLKM